MNNAVQTNNRTWKYLFIVGVLLVVISAVVIGILPDGKMGSDDLKHADLYWLIAGILHCASIILSVLGWIKLQCRCEQARTIYTSKRIIPIIILVIIWFFLIIPKIQSGYIRNQVIKVDDKGVVIK